MNLSVAAAIFVLVAPNAVRASCAISDPNWSECNRREYEDHSRTMETLDLRDRIQKLEDAMRDQELHRTRELSRQRNREMEDVIRDLRPR